MWSSVPPLPAAATKDLCRAALPSPATTSCCCRSWLRPWRQDGRRDADKGPMSLFDDNPGPRGEVGDLQDHLADVSESPSAEALAPLAGDPISYVAIHPEAAHPPASNLPEDLRITWSWPHLVLFAVYAVVSQFAIGIAVLAYYSTNGHPTINLGSDSKSLRICLCVRWPLVE